jgi:intein/homing endonuclease
MPEVSEELAYLSGVIAGDGSISIRLAKNEYSVTCAGNAADEVEFYQIVIAPLMKKLFGITVKLKAKKDGTYGFSICSKQLVHFLLTKLDLPLGKKYDQLQIPELLLEDQRLTLAFIRGVFDTDGCMTFKRRYRADPYYPVISFTSKSEKFAEDVAKMLLLHGFRVVVCDQIQNDKRAKDGYTRAKRAEMNGEYNFSLWQEKIGFWNPKHNEKIARKGFEPSTSGL